MNFIRELRELQAAEAETGVTGKNSIGATYRAALRQIGMDTSELDGPAAQAVFRAVKNRRKAQHAMATDSAVASRRNDMFPHADRLHKGY